MNTRRWIIILLLILAVGAAATAYQSAVEVDKKTHDRLQAEFNEKIKNLKWETSRDCTGITEAVAVPPKGLDVLPKQIRMGVELYYNPYDYRVVQNDDKVELRLHYTSSFYIAEGRVLSSMYLPGSKYCKEARNFTK